MLSCECLTPKRKRQLLGLDQDACRRSLKRSSGYSACGMMYFGQRTQRHRRHRTRRMHGGPLSARGSDRYELFPVSSIRYARQTLRNAKVFIQNLTSVLIYHSVFYGAHVYVYSWRCMANLSSTLHSCTAPGRTSDYMYQGTILRLRV